MLYPIFVYACLFSGFWACGYTAVDAGGGAPLVAAPKTEIGASVRDTSAPRVPRERLVYAWLSALAAEVERIEDLPLPAGCRRTEAAEGSFGEWLRGLPLLPQGSKVMLYNDSEKPYQDGAYRVLDIDIGKSDLQQCADAVMRLRAEYFYGRAEYQHIRFNYTNGVRVAFDDWRRGKKPSIANGKTVFSEPSGKTDNSYPNFQKYLRSIFTYAGTASLEKELKKRDWSELEMGDVVIKGGFPGHAVLVMDKVRRSADGEVLFLLAQSYMPAQSIHLLRNPANADGSPWYSVKQIQAAGQVVTPEWTFDAQSLRTW